MARPQRVCIVSASGQNVFFSEILEAFRDAMVHGGYVIEESVDHFPPLQDDLVYMFIPHEFFPLVAPAAHPSVSQLKRSVAIGTEQPGTEWFELVADLAARAGATVDINVLGTKELERREIAAQFVPLGYVASWDHWHGEAVKRSIDLTFLGGYNERRAHALARCAPVLEGRTSALYLTETGRPHRADAAYFFSHERKWRLMADSKVILNVHRAELGYLEWHRILGAILNGCVVLSEPSIGFEPLVPGEHFVTVEYDDIPFALEALIGDEQRLEGIRRAAYDTVRGQLPMERTAEVLADAVDTAARRPRGRSGDWGLPVPSPVILDPPQSGWEAHAEVIGRELPTRMALKHLLLRTRAIERRLNQLEGSDEAPEDIVEQFGPLRDKPRVSVLLTVYNYAEHVGAALRSVALSKLTDIEVVAIDDASTDHSVEAIRGACAELPWLSVKLVRRQRNGGLPAARNLAAAHAKGDLLFILDADNELMPNGLDLLADALDSTPEASFAYGIIETFDESGPIGLMSWLDWDPAHLRQGNYIDAMAMLRRSALERIGGYPTDEALYGWEDFSVWVAMADAGMGGVRVPQFIARYRIAPHSMISISNVDTSAAWATLLRKYPSLTEPPTTSAP
ncbi:MAG: glycosyltransferase [Actinobacteria bacterium]|nr:glycosyltransferase [Actinomycetota bacterium]